MVGQKLEGAGSTGERDSRASNFGRQKEGKRKQGNPKSTDTKGNLVGQVENGESFGSAERFEVGQKKITFIRGKGGKVD